MRVAGIGCRKGVAAGDVLAALEVALAALLPPGGGERGGRSGEAEPCRLPLDALATSETKMREPAIVAAAKTLGLPLVPVVQEELQRAAARCLTRSAASLAATGTPSLAEAAALAAAGREGRLLGPRIVAANVTCAIAQDRNET